MLALAQGLSAGGCDAAWAGMRTRSPRVYTRRMAAAPMIGISGFLRSSRDINTPEFLWDRRVAIYYHDYGRAVAAAGGLPVYLPFSADPGMCARRLDGILLTGGTDIDPARYGHDPSPELFAPEPERDAFELALLDAAAELRRPLLGICRGFQMLNVHGGGTLNQHVPSHARFDRASNAAAHEVAFTPGSLMTSFYGSSQKVNSLHHQTLDSLASDYTATGWADDGATVEAIESESRPWVGVQWHPEWMDGSDSDPVFAWLVEKCASRRAGA